MNTVFCFSAILFTFSNMDKKNNRSLEINMAFMAFVSLVILVGFSFVSQDNATKVDISDEIRASAEAGERMHYECDDLPIHSMIECVNDGEIIIYGDYR